MFSKKKVVLIYIPVICIVYIVLSVSSYVQKSPTFDEGIIIASGNHYLTTGKNDINAENPPILKALFAFPTLFMNVEQPTSPDIKYSYNMNSELIYAGKFLYQEHKAEQILNYARFINVLLTLLAGIFLYLTITIYLKKSFGLLGFLLFIFSPNILAHARLATVDTGLMMFMFGANYFLIKGLKNNRNHYFVWVGIMAGLAMLCKFTGLLIIPIFAVQLLIFCIFTRQDWWKKFLFASIRFVLICLIALLVVNIFYGFKGFGKPIDAYNVKSPLLKYFVTQRAKASVQPLIKRSPEKSTALYRHPSAVALSSYAATNAGAFPEFKSMLHGLTPEAKKCRPLRGLKKQTLAKDFTIIALVDPTNAEVTRRKIIKKNQQIIPAGDNTTIASGVAKQNPWEQGTKSLKPPPGGRHFFEEGLISKIPILLPHDYVKGFDIVAYNNKPGFPNIYMGKYYPLGGTWWDYYLILMGIKIPVPLLLLIAIGLIYSIFILRKKWVFYIFLIPPLAIFANFSFLAYRQSGFRYILPIMPYLFFAAVIGFRYLYKNSKLLVKIMAILIVIWFIFESMLIYPNYLTYFNQFVGGPEGGKDYFAATNLDWGQDLPGLKKWLDKHNNPPIRLVYYGHAKPSYYGIKQSKTPKYIAISVTNTYIHAKNPYIFKLLKTKPIANIGNSIYIWPQN